MDTDTTQKRKAGRPTDGHARKNLCLYVRQDAIAEFQRQADSQGLKQAEFFNAVYAPAEQTTQSKP